MVNRATQSPPISRQQPSALTGLGKWKDATQSLRPPKIHPNAPPLSRTQEREMGDEWWCQAGTPGSSIFGDN